MILWLYCSRGRLQQDRHRSRPAPRLNDIRSVASLAAASTIGLPVASLPEVAVGHSYPAFAVTVPHGTLPYTYRVARLTIGELPPDRGHVRPARQIHRYY